jgi:hypothetical protein
MYFICLLLVNVLGSLCIECEVDDDSKSFQFFSAIIPWNGNSFDQLERLVEFRLTRNMHFRYPSIELETQEQSNVNLN